MHEPLFHLNEEDTAEPVALGDASLSPTNATAGATETRDVPQDFSKNWQAEQINKLTDKLNEKGFSNEEVTRLSNWIKRHVRSDYLGNPKQDMQKYNALRPVERFVEHNFGGNGPRDFIEIRELRAHLPRNFNGKAVHLFYCLVMLRKDYEYKIQDHELLVKFIKPIVFASPSFKTHYCVMRDTHKALSRRYSMDKILNSSAQDMFKLNMWQHMSPEGVLEGDSSMISEQGYLTYDACSAEFIEPIMHMVMKNADFGWTANDGATFKEAFHVVWLQMPLLRPERYKNQQGFLHLPRFMWVFAEEETRYYDNYKTMEKRYKELDAQYRVLDDVLPHESVGVNVDVPGIYGSQEILDLNKRFPWTDYLPLLCKMRIPIDRSKSKAEEFKRISEMAIAALTKQKIDEEIAKAAACGDEDDDGKVLINKHKKHPGITK